MIGASSRIQLTYTILEVPIPQPTGPVIDITPHEQPESPLVAPKGYRGKGKVTDDVESPKKLAKASSKVHPDPDEPVRLPYEIHGKLYHLTNDEIQAHLDKEEKKMKKAVKEAKLLAMRKLDLINVVHEEASKAGIDPKILESAKGDQEFMKIQDYIWTTSSRLKPKPITDVKIYPNTKPAVIIVYRGTDRRNFQVYNPFKFGDFGLTELEELGPIIQKKKNKILALFAPSPEQTSSQLPGRKRKILELEPEIRIPRLECNRSLPEGVPFVNIMVIEEPEYGMFFIDVFGDEAFQRMEDIHKLDIETLLTYLVMASNITTSENQRFYLKLRKLIGSHPDQNKLKSKKVKLESIGYKLDRVLMNCFDYLLKTLVSIPEKHFEKRNTEKSKDEPSSSSNTITDAQSKHQAPPNPSIVSSDTDTKNKAVATIDVFKVHELPERKSRFSSLTVSTSESVANRSDRIIKEGDNIKEPSEMTSSDVDNDVNMSLKSKSLPTVSPKLNRSLQPAKGDSQLV
ncbi:hypothetical protein Tco_0826802 [Tanacetum coccineum]